MIIKYDIPNTWLFFVFYWLSLNLELDKSALFTSASTIGGSECPLALNDLFLICSKPLRAILVVCQ